MMIRRTVLASLAASTLLSAPAAAHDPLDGGLVDTLTRGLIQTALGFVRGYVDLTYDAVTVDARSGSVTLSGVSVFPELPWDESRACVITTERLTLADAGDLTRLDGVMTLSGVTVPMACLEPEQGAMIASFGFPVITADSIGITAAYDAPSAGLSLLVEASISEAIAVTVSADFDYFAPRDFAERMENPEGSVEDIIPSAVLGSAELVIENRGLFEALAPMLEARLGDLQAIPALAQAGLLQALSEGGRRDPDFAERAFADEVAEGLTAFIEERRLIVVSADPEPGVRLSEEIFETPGAIIGALEPRVSTRPLARARIVDPALLSAALEAPEGLSAADRRLVGIAMITGIGAPRAPEVGIGLLEPLALEGDGPAAAAMAEALAEAGRLEDAYAAALSALAADDTGVAALADRLEGALPLAEVVAIQERTGPADALDAARGALAAGDLSALRRRAEAHATGVGAARSVTAALTLATAAAAGGDRAAAGLMRRLENRYRARAEDAEAYEALRAAASDAALQLWLADGLAERLR